MKQTRKRFPWVLGMVVSGVLVAILGFVVVVLLVLRTQGITQGVTTLTILSIVFGVVLSLLSLLLAFLQWHHPKAPPESEKITAAPILQTPPLSTAQAGALPNNPRQRDTEKASLPSSYQRGQRFDWGEAPHMDQFYGRERELATLKHWMIDDACRLVAILGMGGIGKTSLAATLIDQVHEHFDTIFWRSLHNAPPLNSLLQECLQFVSEQQLVILPEEVDRHISLLMEHFRTHRCLLVLDNVESIFQGGSQAGQYREGYEGYGRLLRRIGESKHQSCLLLTSREKPPEVALLEGRAAATTQSLHLGGLPSGAGQEILSEKGLQGTEQDWQRLISHYGGNPLALKLVAQMIREVFAGSIGAFLLDGEVFFRDVRDVLEQQMKRLSALEEEIISWLAIEREAVTLTDLQEDIVRARPRGEFQEALQSLHRRYLIETSATGFTLQPVIMEYLTDRLVERACEEIQTQTLELLDRYALLKAQTKEYIRESQRRLIIQPLLRQLLAIFGKEALEQRFQSLLATLRTQPDQHSGYAAGNVLNLLIQMRCSLRGYDFSRLVVRQAYLQGIDLPDVNFAQADVANSVFTDTFRSILCVAFSPRGDLLVAGTTAGEIRFWHAGSGLPLLTIQGHNNLVRSVAFSPDGTALASGSEDHTVRLWEVNSGRELTTLQGHTGIVRSVAFSPDGKLLASGSDDWTVRLWEISTGKCLTILQGHSHWVWSVRFSPDGKLLASGGEDHTVRLWEVSTGKEIATLQDHTSIVKSVAFSPDGKLLASGSDDHTVRLWEASTGQCLTILQGHTAGVRSVAFSPDGTALASGSTDRTVRLWGIGMGKVLTTLQGHTDIIRSIAFSPDGKALISGSNDGTVRLWEVNTSRCLITFQGHMDAARSVAFSPDGKTLASAGYDRAVRLWEVNSGKEIITLHGHTDRVRSVAFSPDGTVLASGSNDRTVRLWEVNSGRCLITFQGHINPVRSVAFSPDGKALASGGEDQIVHVWEVSTGKVLTTLQGHSRWVWSVAFSPDGKLLASGGDDYTIRLWEVSTGKALTILQGHLATVASVAFSPDGKLLASGSDDQTMRLWEVNTGKDIVTLHGHADRVRSVAFSPDGKLLASGGGDHTVRLWEVSTGEEIATLQGHSYWVRAVAFSSDGKLLASGGYDGTINLWDVQTHVCLHTLRSDRPYERMNISQVKGLTEAQKAALKELGAIELA